MATQNQRSDDDISNDQLTEALIKVRLFSTQTTQSTFSDSEIHQNIRSTQKKVSEALNQLDKISGKINALLAYWKISDVSCDVEVKDLLKEIKDYKKILESYPGKINAIKGSSENLCLLFDQILGIQIPQLADFRFPQPIPLKDIVKSALERKFTSPGKSIVEFVIRDFGKHLVKWHGFQEVIWSASSAIGSIAMDIGPTVLSEYKSWGDAKKMITDVRIKFIELALKEKFNRINRFLQQAMVENQSTPKIAMKQSISLVKESIRNCKENVMRNDPEKDDIDFVKEMSESPLCAGLILPIMNSCNCSSYLAWAIIQEQFLRPRPHSAV